MDTLRISISQLHPGHVPKKSSWERYQEFSDYVFVQEHRYTPFGIALLDGVSFVLDGNHRIAMLYGLGIEEILYFERSLTIKNELFWRERINDLHKKRIYSFSDFLSQCQSGRFYR